MVSAFSTPGESGSWPGGSLTDLDYDVRFIYCHPAEWYLTLDEGRDTPDYPVDESWTWWAGSCARFYGYCAGRTRHCLSGIQSPVVHHEALDFRRSCTPVLPAAFNLISRAAPLAWGNCGAVEERM
jgi:hypothetical protein